MWGAPAGRALGDARAADPATPQAGHDSPVTGGGRTGTGAEPARQGVTGRRRLARPALRRGPGAR